MGRTAPSRGGPTAAQRRDARSKRAKATLNKDIPALLKSNSRAQRGVQSSELILKIPQNDESNPATYQQPPLQVRFEIADTLEAAARLLRYKKHHNASQAKVTILNMASPLRPGGGWLTGAQAQEESLCMRSTLYPALREEFYRLPEIGAVYTEDILIFRGWDRDMTDFAKHDRFFVDVITAAMPRFPDTSADETDGIKYTDAKDKILVENKMRALMRILKMKNARNIVLGAWGCGAYKNPIREVAQLWRKVLLGEDNAVVTDTSSIKRTDSEVENWAGMQVVFAINDPKMAHEFAAAFGYEVTKIEEQVPLAPKMADEDGDEGENEQDSTERELRQKIVQTKEQIQQTRNPELRHRLEAILAVLEKQTLTDT